MAHYRQRPIRPPIGTPQPGGEHRAVHTPCRTGPIESQYVPAEALVGKPPKRGAQRGTLDAIAACFAIASRLLFLCYGDGNRSLGPDRGERFRGAIGGRLGRIVTAERFATWGTGKSLRPRAELRPSFGWARDDPVETEHIRFDRLRIGADDFYGQLMGAGFQIVLAQRNRTGGHNLRVEQINRLAELFPV